LTVRAFGRKRMSRNGKFGGRDEFDNGRHSSFSGHGLFAFGRWPDKMAFTHYIGFPFPKFQSFCISRLDPSASARAVCRRNLGKSKIPEKTERCLRHFHVLNFSSNELPGRNSRLQTRRDCAVGEAHSGLARSGSRSWAASRIPQKI